MFVKIADGNLVNTLNPYTGRLMNNSFFRKCYHAVCQPDTELLEKMLHREFELSRLRDIHAAPSLGDELTLIKDGMKYLNCYLFIKIGEQFNTGEAALFETMNHNNQLINLDMERDTVRPVYVAICKKYHDYYKSCLHPVMENSDCNPLVQSAINLLYHTFLLGQDLKELSVSYCAKKLFVSPKHLSETFARSKGVPLTTFINLGRIEYAKVLLGFKRFSLTEVANRSGFRDIKYFTSCFKKAIGITPAQYRGQLIPQGAEPCERS